MQVLMAVLLMMLLCGSGTELFAQEVGHAAVGAQIVQQLCTDCHKIEAGQRRPESDDEDDEAPSFVEIANDPSTTPLSLRVFFQSNHENMPNLHISQEQADDLVAYILSLKRK
jgi:mono/diheme cytochrome c family protein